MYLKAPHFIFVNIPVIALFDRLDIFTYIVFRWLAISDLREDGYSGFETGELFGVAVFNLIFRRYHVFAQIIHCFIELSRSLTVFVCCDS